MEGDSDGDDGWTRSLSTLMVLEPDTSGYGREIERWSEGEPENVEQVANADHLAGINSDGQMLTKLVRGLGEYLTSQEDKTREQGRSETRIKEDLLTMTSRSCNIVFHN